MPSSPSPEPLPPALDAKPPLIAVVGPTACGKSDWAMTIAQRLNGEIVSIDSRQIYRRLDIGTATPSADMQAEVPHWCLNLIEPDETYSLGAYMETARAAISDIESRGKRPIAVGGSGQHMRALLEGWQIPPIAADLNLRNRLEQLDSELLWTQLHDVDPSSAIKIGGANRRRLIRALEVYELSGVPISEWQRRRLPIQAIVVGPSLPLSDLDRRIDARAASMFEAGLVDEVRTLLNDGLPQDAPGFDAIGYREVLVHLRGDLSIADAQTAVATATKRFARRQRAWFRQADPSIYWSTDVPIATLR